ncbi:MAG: proline--tRNA ligase [Clostridia bacterium]|nr:proline--tRNA ligase [Clostridia bacterium]
MRVSQLLGRRFKEAPASCIIDSHKLTVRGGYIKYMANGIYSLFMPMKRITRKIENIIREEMDRIDGQEVMFPVAMPASLWEESGRYFSIGNEMARFTDRSGNKMVLGITHEEAAVHMAKNVAESYAQYPFMIYQIQTKFRDEPRARGGLIRVREFTMKDAYSFHTSQEDLERYYARCYEAYERIFKRAGVKNFIAVKSDSGMMGGSISHEFMLLSDIGEDTLVICPECGYSANMEAAECITENEPGDREELALINTPDVSTIEDLTSFMGVSPERFAKAVVYQKNKDDKYVVVFIRGDLDVNETKLRNHLGEEIHPGVVTEESGIVAGFIGPKDLKGAETVVFDRSLKGIESLVTGANRPDCHYKGFNFERDLGKVEYADVAKTYAGAPCPCCGKRSVTIKKGIEIGNIFQLGTKYTKAMDMTYLDANGEAHYPIMGCYGIGVGRLAASICQESCDEYGPIWPISVAPWEVEICNLRSDDDEVLGTSENLYEDLKKAGVEVLYDDRDIRPGSMFADADLLGVPVRVVVSPKTCQRGVVEVTTRDKTLKTEFPAETAAADIVKLVEELKKQYELHK